MDPGICFARIKMQKLKINMDSPKISVLMSAYNNDSYLKPSINSILNQSFANFELILIDDGSADQSLAIMQNLAVADSRVKILRNPENRGLTKSLNQGLKIAQGKYIGREDADDLSRPERLKTQYEYLEKHPEIFLSGSSAILIDEKGKTIGNYFKKNNPEKLEKILKRHNHILHSSIMFRNQNIFYREKFYFSQDYDLYLRLLSNGKKITNLAQTLIQYRCHRSSLSFKDCQKQKKFALLARKFYNQRLKSGRDEYDSFDPQTILGQKRKTYFFLSPKVRITLAHLRSWRD